MDLEERRRKERTDPTCALIKCDWQTVYFFAMQRNNLAAVLKLKNQIIGLQKQIIDTEEERTKLVEANSVKCSEQTVKALNVASEIIQGRINSVVHSGLPR